MKVKIGDKRSRKTKNGFKHLEVVDILKTYNSNNELVKTQIVSVEEYLGQQVYHTTPVSTVARALLKK